MGLVVVVIEADQAARFTIFAMVALLAPVGTNGRRAVDSPLLERIPQAAVESAWT